nr:retrovirus-related Pol polyprotein from transposon TNT 1-94 [Tanacetum cinerariifolium]
MVDNTLFTKKKGSNLIIVQIYVDDIIFGSACQDICDEFAKIMLDEFDMIMIGEVNFFFGLQMKDGIFFNQSKYITKMLKKFGLEEYKPMKTSMSFDTKLIKDEECESVDSTKYQGMIGLWYPRGTGIETIVYVDSDHAGDYVDRKRTSGICTFVRYCLTSWFSKKQTALTISTTESEYVSAEKACQQALWMKQDLIDYVVRLDDVPIMCDNKGAIDLSKNPLANGVPTDGPYQTNPPSPDDIISSIQIDREGQVHHICHEKEIDVQEYQILPREIVPTLNPLEEIIRENIFCLGTRKDRGTRRGRHSTSSSFAFDQPSSSHLNDDDDDDGNDEGTLSACTPSPIFFVNSLTNEVPQVFQNPPNIDPHLEPFYTHQTEIINCQVHIRDDHHGGLRSIGKGLRNL